MAANFGIFDDCEFEAALKKEFLSEARDLLEEVEPSFLKYEKDPSSPHEMAQIFRLVHTFKGSAGVAGFKGLAAFAHNFETLLSRLRNNEITASPQVIEALLIGNDTLRSYVHALELNNEAIWDTCKADQIISDLLGKTGEDKPTRTSPEPLLDSSCSKIAAPSPPEVIPTRVKIILADDEKDLRESLAFLLTDAGYDVVQAEDGQHALELTLAHPDTKLLITDQNMPRIKGEDLVAKLRSQGINIPVIVITGMANHDAATKFIQSGVYSYLTKPVDASDVIIATRNALESGFYFQSLTELLRLSFRSYMKLRRTLSETDPTKDSSLIAEDIEKMGDLISQILLKKA